MTRTKQQREACRGCGTETALALMVKQPDGMEERVPLCAECVGEVIRRRAVQDLVVAGLSSGEDLLAEMISRVHWG